MIVQERSVFDKNRSDSSTTFVWPYSILFINFQFFKDRKMPESDDFAISVWRLLFCLGHSAACSNQGLHYNALIIRQCPHNCVHLAADLDLLWLHSKAIGNGKKGYSVNSSSTRIEATLKNVHLNKQSTKPGIYPNTTLCTSRLYSPYKLPHAPRIARQP